jgi:hypothetical protein
VGRDTVAQARITNISNQWIQQYPTDIVVRSVLVSGDTAKIIITGPEPPSTIQDLGKDIKAEVGWIANVDLKHVPSRAYVFP